MDLHGARLYRNLKCSNFCGHAGDICEAGATTCPFASLPHLPLTSDVQLVRGVSFEGKFADLAVVRDGMREFRLIFPLDSKIESATAVIRQHGLTPRELEIAAMMIAGLSNLRISDGLGIARDTVKTHIKKIYRKLPAAAHRLFGDRDARAG